jgi:deoxyribonuclease-1-like protein
MRSAMALFAALLIFGCAIQTQEPPGQPNATNQSEGTPVANISADNITIAAFNIQVFGKSKASDNEVMGILAKTARNFDIIAIQEIRDSDQTALPMLLGRINSLGLPHYNFTVGPRLGRTSSKEQYAYIYKEGILLLGNQTFNDSSDLFHREPYMARFMAGDFDFVLVTLHSDPDETPQELDSLALVVEEAKALFSEDDIILLGDMNAECSYLKKSDNVSIRSNEYIWLIGDDIDTTTKSTDCAYDRIIITSGLAGAFRFDEEYGLNQSMSESVSDHYPVWATFITSQEQEG